ncbi:MAG: FHA domain-containing protein [Myxococcales bacterium]|nr:FHA domain-containing protein [Myxococcales bacterium]
MDIGLVCDQCSTLSAMGTPRCVRCGSSLALEEETRVGTPALRAPAPADPTASQPCVECGELVPPNHRFCGGCGARVDAVRPRPAPAAPAEKGTRRTMFFGAMQAARAKLTLIRGDGLDGVSFTLAGEEHLAGRVDCPILFPDDPFLSPVHANFFYRDGKLVVRDEGSANGVFVRIAGQVDLPLGNRFLVGEQMLEVELVPAIDEGAIEDGTYFFASPRRGGDLRIVQRLRGGDTGFTYGALGATIRIGREGNDIDFPDDPFISGHHAHLAWDGAHLTLTDLGSKNGTFLRITHERTLVHGDYVFMGQQLLRVEIV